MPGFADVTILLDRSGSMNSIRKPTVEGINKFIRDVLDVPGDGCWTLVQFDDPPSAAGAKEDFPHIVFSQKCNESVPLVEDADFSPRGGTALIDAVCRTIAFTRERLKALPEGQRDNRRVMIVIVTDGEENSSHEFTTADMRAMIARSQAEDRWEYQFLAANQDAFAEAGKYGLSHSFNYPGMVGTPTAVCSGSVGSGQIANTSVMSFQPTAGSFMLAMLSGGFGVRAWKADGDENAMKFLTPCPEPGAVPGVGVTAGCISG